MTRAELAQAVVDRGYDYESSSVVGGFVDRVVTFLIEIGLLLGAVVFTGLAMAALVAVRSYRRIASGRVRDGRVHRRFVPTDCLRRYVHGVEPRRRSATGRASVLSRPSPGAAKSSRTT